MFLTAKYAVGTDQLSGVRSAVVFSELVRHTSAEGFFAPNSITSAGFFVFDDTKVTVYGKSTGLNCQAIPEDEELVGRAIGHPAYGIKF